MIRTPVFRSNTGMWTSAVPMVLMLAGTAAHAQTADNSATVTMPSGAFETNAANNTATDSDTILATIVATSDTVSGINGSTGATAAGNVFSGDTVNGVAASATNATLAVAAGSSVPAGLTFDTATGSVDVVAGTAAGNYSFSYSLCETANPTNCQAATISVAVVAGAITADSDSVTGVDGLAGTSNVLDVLAGDTLNNTQVTLADVTLAVTTPATPASSGVPVPVLDPATGQVSVPAGTPAGSYTITYQICDKLNPTNCASNSATIVVAAATLVASNDSAGGINGLTGATAVLNALTADTVNGAAASTANATLALAAGSSVPAGLAFDTATGSVDVAAGTAAGTYSFDYTLCDTLNPTNCQTATISVTVEAAAIAAGADSVLGVDSAQGAANIVNVLANDTLNGAAIDPAKVTLSILAPASPVNGGAVPVLDPASGQVSVPENTPAGNYTIAYQICENLNPANCASSSVTIEILPSRSDISGAVFTDVNGDRQLDDEDIRSAGWLVEVVLDDAVVASTTTDENGDYTVKGLLSGPGYAIRFRHPENNVVYGIIDELTLIPGEAAIDKNLPIDPSGVVYDSVSRNAVAKATVTMTDRNGSPLPVPCFVDRSQQHQVTGASGQYRFDLVPGAASQCPTGESEYRITLTPPAGNSFVSSVLLPQDRALNPTDLGSPYQVSTSRGTPTGAEPVYYLSFLLGSGDPHVVNNHIPIDPFLTRNPLVVTKTSTTRSASTGDLVPYEITVRNTEGSQRAGVDVIDILPAGMRYVTGSAAADGVHSEPESANSNRALVWRDQVIPANGSVRYNLTLIVGAGVTTGERINTGLAENGSDGAVISNRGTASVAIVPSSVFDCSELLGKVFQDTNRNGYQDEGEPGVPGARLATVNGQLVTTDEHGRYHIACAAVPDSRIGSNYVLKLDLRTVPLGWEATTDNPRSIRLTRGMFGELNFGVAPPAEEQSSTTRNGGE